jgi:hypothetical protein
VFARGSEQYNIQTSVRLSTTSITDTVRYATALHIEENKPNIFEADDLYYYIYFENSNVYYSYLDSEGNRKTRVLGTDITSLAFTKQSNSLVGMSVSGVERNQTYDINMDIGLPNMGMRNNDVFGTSGSVLKFQKDTTITNLSSSTEVRLNRESDFSMFNGDEFLFYANRDVNWTLIGTGFKKIDGTVRSFKVKADGVIGNEAWIRATSIADPSNYREVKIIIVEKSYSVRIVKSDLTEIVGSLNLVEGQKEELMVITDPPLDLEGDVEITAIFWSGATPGVYAFTENILAPEYLEVTGQNVGGLADLRVEVEFSDHTVLYDAIIINVSSAVEYAKLLSLSFENSTLIPAFDPDITSYTVTGTGNRKLTATTNVGANIVISPHDSNNIYNLSNKNMEIKVTVSESGKLTRTYTIITN